MIDPDGIPQLSAGSVAQVAADAQALLEQGALLTESGASLASVWAGLPGVFATPDTADVVEAVWPVRTITTSVGADVRVIGGALQTYADAVGPIAAALSELKAQAFAFRASVQGQQDWTRDGDRVDAHNRLIAGVNTQVAALSDAERACANQTG